MLSTLAVLPLPLSNGVGDLSKELAYARSHGVAGLDLVNGLKPFSSNLVTAILGGGGSVAHPPLAVACGPAHGAGPPPCLRRAAARMRVPQPFGVVFCAP